MQATHNKLVVGNWKMNGNRAANAELLAALKAAGPWVCGVAVCAPAPYLGDVALSLQGESIGWGAQDCSAFESGAYTGEVSAAMLAEFGCRYVLVGHSERRAMHGETDHHQRCQDLQRHHQVPNQVHSCRLRNSSISQAGRATDGGELGHLQ